MNKILIISLLVICLLYFSCSKDKQSGPQGSSNSIKVELVSGDKQTDTIGYGLENLVVKVTQNGNPLSDYSVQFQGSGCNSDNVEVFKTGTNGTVLYNWILAGDVGQQTLKIIAFSATNQKVDSVTATSTALAPAPGPGWHYAACTLPHGGLPSGFCKLSTGRLFAAFQVASSYLRYSDDNGINWYAVTGAGRHGFQYVFSTAADELFAFSTDAGISNSKDGGETWNALASKTPFNNYDISSAMFAKSGKLLVSTLLDGIYFSIDKGQTWTKANVPGFQFQSFTEDQNGNLYAVDSNYGILYESTDGGVTWTALNQAGSESVACFYIDANNWFYKSRYDNSGGIYISKDNGNTYSKLFSSPNAPIANMSIQSDGNFYFGLSGSGLYQEKGVAAPFHLIFYNTDPFTYAPYIVAKNNYIIAISTTDRVIKFYQQ